jgi:hypothetical protein
MRTKKIRTRYYLAVEGEGEQSFIKWLQQLCDEENLNVHLDCQVLGGGGYQSMLRYALHCQKQRNGKKRFITAGKASILLLDADRGNSKDDGWSHSDLRKEALKDNFTVCLQMPNQEGWFLCMLSKENTKFDTISDIQKKIKKIWPEYRKPVNTRELSSKFSSEDLFFAASVFLDLQELLKKIGLSDPAT